MVNINDRRRARRQNPPPVLKPERKTRLNFLLHSMGLLTSVIGPALVVCLAGGSILVLAAVVFYDALGAVVGVMLYRDATRATVVSVVPSIRDEVPDLYQLRPAA